MALALSLHIGGVLGEKKGRGGGGGDRKNADTYRTAYKLLKSLFLELFVCMMLNVKIDTYVQKLLQHESSQTDFPLQRFSDLERDAG